MRSQDGSDVNGLNLNLNGNINIDYNISINNNHVNNHRNQNPLNTSLTDLMNNELTKVDKK